MKRADRRFDVARMVRLTGVTETGAEVPAATQVVLSTPAEVRTGLGLGSLVDAHLGVVSAGIGLMTIVVKLMAASHGDVATIGAILQFQGSGDVIVSSVVVAAANFAFVASIFAIPQWGEAVRERDPLTVPTVNLVASLVVVAVLAPAQHLPLLGIYIAWFGVTSTIWAARARRKGTRKLFGGIGEPSRRSYGLILGMGLSLLWIVTAGNARMWLPPERFELQGRGDMVGYALASDDESVTVLREADRAIERVQATRIERRTFCRIEDEDPRTLMNLILGHDRPRYPLCQK